MRRGLVVLIATAALAAALDACASGPQPAGQPAATPSSASAAPSPAPSAPTSSASSSVRASLGSGIDGQTVIVVCPVDRGDPPCPVTPVQARLAVIDAAGKTVATVDTDAQGHFSVALPAGRYVLRSVTVGGRAARAEEAPVTVADGRYTSMTMRLNDGRR